MARVASAPPPSGERSASARLTPTSQTSWIASGAGAGTVPPELAGRDELIERAAVALDRIRAGKSARSLILHGLRGVGKTVLLNRIRIDAEARGVASVKMEAPEGRSLPALLVPALRAALLRLRRGGALRGSLLKGTRALAGFAKALKVKYQDIELSIDVDPEAGLVDSGDLGVDLTDLLVTLGQAAGERETAIVLFVDVLQYVPQEQLAALAELDSSFFRVRFDRLTPTQKRYLRAMAELGPGPHRSGDIAQILKRKVTSVAPTRNTLIGKGVIYSPAHGDTAFTAPLFDDFLKRIMPEP